MSGVVRLQIAAFIPCLIVEVIVVLVADLEAPGVLGWVPCKVSGP